MMIEDPMEVKARRLWKWIDSHREVLAGIVAARDVLRAGAAGIQNCDEAQKLLGMLADRGYLMESSPEAGMRASRYHIHPKRGIGL